MIQVYVVLCVENVDLLISELEQTRCVRQERTRAAKH